MAYESEFTSTDLTPITIDAVAKIIIALGSLAILIALIFVARIFFKK